MGTRHPAAFVPIPSTLGANVAQDYHRNIDALHGPQKTELLVLGLDRTGIEHEVADPDMPAEKLRIGFGHVRIDTVRNHAESIQRKIESPGDPLGLDVRVGQ